MHLIKLIVQGIAAAVVAAKLGQLGAEVNNLLQSVFLFSNVMYKESNMSYELTA